MGSDEKAIRDLVATWAQATRSGDGESVLKLMAEDVVFLVPGQPPMRGRAEFERALAGAAKFAIEASNDIREIRIFGDWAYCWNRLSVVLTPRDGGKPSRRAGDVLSILQKQNGRWVIVRDANMLTPAAS